MGDFCKEKLALNPCRGIFPSTWPAHLSLGLHFRENRQTVGLSWAAGSSLTPCHLRKQGSVISWGSEGLSQEEAGL